MVRRLLLCALCCAGLSAGEVAAYQLFPGDLIRIAVFGHADLEVDARVPAGGEITYPLIGALVNVAGRSPEALAGEITTRLADGYIRNPSVTVQVREYGPRTVWVVGAVKAAGPVKLDPLRPSTALQAVGAAGGFDEDADRSGALVMRDDPAKPGAKSALPVPVADAPQQDVELRHGDVVVVPRADRIFVLGQVQYPRAVPIPAREVLTVSKAISLAGGFGRFAKETKVQLVRRGAQPVIVDVRAVLDGEQGVEDPPLKAGDTVFVPESRF
jgi:polysaccharide export outer membrane protein